MEVSGYYGKQNSHQDNSDVWDYCRNWGNQRASLIQRLSTQSFRFQVVSERRCLDADGSYSYREIRCAEDRLLIRAIAQVLTPFIHAATPSGCIHLEGRGGLKQAVRDTQAYMHQHPEAHVFKSDVKGYYASIQHSILYDRLCVLLPNEPILCRLIWQSLQRTVERGGNYRDIEQGLPLGSSLSPLYLISLDTAFGSDPAIFYRRYIDDWVIIVNTRRQLRRTTKGVYAVLKSLRVDKHPDKTWIGRVKRGIDFLGFRISPTSIQPSAASVSRRDKKVARLYERGASERRIGLYLGRWLVWGLAWAAPLVAHADLTPYANCVDSPNMAITANLTSGGLTSDRTGYDYVTCFPKFGNIAIAGPERPTQPYENYTCDTQFNPTATGAVTAYWLSRSTNDDTGEYCLYQFDFVDGKLTTTTLLGPPTHSLTIAPTTNAAEPGTNGVFTVTVAPAIPADGTAITGTVTWGGDGHQRRSWHATDYL